MRITLCKAQFLGAISGADETLVTYAVQLKKLRHDVSVLLLFPYLPQDERYLRLIAAGVRVVTIAPSPVSATLEMGRKIARKALRVFPSSQQVLRSKAHKISRSITFKYEQQCGDTLRALSPDIVHVVTPDSGAMVFIRAAHAARIPVLYQELGIPYHPPDFAFSYEHFTTVLPLCAEIAALSPLLARQCHERLPGPNRLSILPIITDDLRNGHSATRNGDPQINIGFAARIEHLKGPLTLLESFAVASRKNHRLRLMIAGAGSLEPKLKARAHALGVASRFELVGLYTKTSQRKAFMEQLDIFALPSLTEGTPNCIAEAMSHGVPVIASAVGGIPDTVTANSGILIPPVDARALTQAIERMAGDYDLRKQMGHAARERYEKLFSPQSVLPTMLNTYRRVASEDLGERPVFLGEQEHPWAHVC